MKKSVLFLALLFVSVLLMGCAAMMANNSVGPDWMATGYTYNNYEIEIISDPPGAKIEWDNEYMGKAPLKTIRHGHRGNASGPTIVKAYPVKTGQYTQVKILNARRPYPRKIYFNMYLRPVRTGY